MENFIFSAVEGLSVEKKKRFMIFSFSKTISDSIRSFLKNAVYVR